MITNKRDISIMLVGESGEGKSAFILSFVNKEDRVRMPANGKGQTTRTSMIYNINCTVKQPLSVKIRLKSKEHFCADRLKKFFKWFGYERIKVNNLREKFKSALIADNAFFNCNEFECSQEINSKYDELFDSAFWDSVKKIEDDSTLESKDSCIVANENFGKFYNLKSDIYKKTGKKLEENTLTEKTLGDCVQLFAEWMYAKCKNEIKAYLQKYSITYKDETDIDITQVEDIQRFIKTESGKISYSSLMDKLIIDTFIVENYRDLMNKIQIDKLTFIDTYGLNHDEQDTPETVKNRYHDLFEDFQDIDTVLYIRKAQNKPPTDLATNIPLLYLVKPSVMSYICFTHIDTVNDNRAIEEMKSTNTDTYCEIQCILLNNGINHILVDKRIKCMSDNIIEYCSMIKSTNNNENNTEVFLDEITDDSEETDAKNFLNNNIKQITKLLLSIRDKKHLGNLIININNILPEKVKPVIDVKKIFSSEPESFYGYPSRTMGALSDRLQYGELGFYSSTYGMFKYWDDEIYQYVKERFFDITKISELELCLKRNDTDSENQEKYIAEVQELFNKFMDDCKKCIKNPNQYMTNHPLSTNCQNCQDKSLCLQNVLYEAKKNIIANKEYPVNKWLTRIYNFKEVLSNEEIKQQLQNIFDILYKESFIMQCREKNARILASELDEEMTESEINEKIKEYYDNYDSEADKEEKIKFEQMVEQFF